MEEFCQEGKKAHPFLILGDCGKKKIRIKTDKDMLIGSTGEALKAASHLPERGHERRLQSRLPSVEPGIPGIKVVESCQTEENLIASIPKLLPMSRW